MRVTRLAKKRAAMETLIGSQFQPANKKRVVLGEISNNADPLENSNVISDVQITKCVSKKVMIAPKTVATAAAMVNESQIEKIEDELIDPQMCETYVSDYLHNMEVFSMI